MNKRSHARSPEKKNFSIALPIVLITDLEKIAKAETRSKNGQIEYFLAEQIKLWKAKNSPVTAPSATLESDSHLKSVPTEANAKKGKSA